MAFYYCGWINTQTVASFWRKVFSAAFNESDKIGWAVKSEWLIRTLVVINNEY